MLVNVYNALSEADSRPLNAASARPIGLPFYIFP